jgi:hypothetical protein
MVRGKIILLAVGLLVLGIGIRLWFQRTPAPRPAAVSPPPAQAPQVPQEAEAPPPPPKTLKGVATIHQKELEAMSRGPWGRSPFLTPEEEAASQQLVARAPEATPGLATLQVRAILISQGRRVATINGHVVTEGDWVGQERVLEIRPQAVVLEKGTNRRTVELQFPTVPVHVGPTPLGVR